MKLNGGNTTVLAMQFCFVLQPLWSIRSDEATEDASRAG